MLQRVNDRLEALSDGAFLALALALWLLTAIVLINTLPLLPVDETRYATVAWEMRQSGNWLLPTLNGEPYSHKPPLLFWLVNMAWLIGGAEVEVARVVPILTSIAVLSATYVLACNLYPDRRSAPAIAVMLTLGPAFLVYGALVMFDQLLTLCVLLGLLTLWRVALSPSWWRWSQFGVALGLGLLAKGPVILVHLLPPAMMVYFWAPHAAVPMRRWFAGVGFAVLIGAGIILAWAIPAALTGGPEFSRMIFWEQSAGRMVKAFDHRHPPWFYIPVLLVFLLPILFWSVVWRGLEAARQRPVPSSVRFLLSWIVPSIAAFVVISGKQPHYLLPHVPGFALIAAWLAQSAHGELRDRKWAAAPFVVAFLVLIAGPMLLRMGGFDTPTKFVSDGIAQISPGPSAVAGLLALAAFFLARTTKVQAMAIAVASSLLIAVVALQADRHVFRFYDLERLADALQPYRAGPIAHVGDYEGEIGFLARLDKPVDVIRPPEIKAWRETHPSGVLVRRQRAPIAVDGPVLIFAMPFRTRDQYVVMGGAGLRGEVESGAASPKAALIMR
jgi:4-amino-4-deoxy-L-arabinose transferase-like glycosyltransferase